MAFRTRVNDPDNTMGATSSRDSRPAGAATRDTSRRKSSWLKTRQADHPGTKACGTCKGTGSSGWKNAKNELIACPSCGGFGY